MSLKLTGTVVSNAADKTAVVKVSIKRNHHLYSKLYTVSKKFKVHDPENIAKVGDKVSIQECRPVSKHKSFVIDKILDKDGK